MANFLYQRITTKQKGSTGTLAEPNGAPEPRFALQSTVNWMRAMTLIVQNQDINWNKMINLYENVQRKTDMEDRVSNTCFEQLLMSLHHLSAIEAMRKADDAINFSRIGIMTWYYGIYCAASAMIAANNGSQQKNHTKTARVWYELISSRGLAINPFDYRLSTLVKSEAEQQVDGFRNGSSFTIDKRPSTVAEAQGACASYLSGSRKYYEWIITEQLKSDREFINRGFQNFRTKEAQKLRDKKLESRTLCFLDIAFRYRGKANYRDALFLTYKQHSAIIRNEFIGDMYEVLKAFLIMSGAYCMRRIPKGLWKNYIEDLQENYMLGVMPDKVWA